MKRFTYYCVFVLIVILSFHLNECNQYGPDPWHNHAMDVINGNANKKHTVPNCSSDYFFRRLLALVLKGGQNEINDDKSRNVNFNLFVSENDWNYFEEFLENEQLTENKLRAVLGRISDNVRRPTLTERLSIAWNEYIHFYLSFYKVELIWCLISILLIVSCKYLITANRKTIVLMIFVNLYLYEAYISYKEAEQQAMMQYGSDTLIFMKHMHPKRILVRLLSITITESLMSFKNPISEISKSITSSLWWPLDTALDLIIQTSLYVLTIAIILMMTCNLLLNSPININLFAGLCSFGISNRHSNVSSPNTNSLCKPVDVGDKLSGENLTKLLNIIQGPGITNYKRQKTITVPKKTIQRSHSAGRICDFKEIKFGDIQRKQAIEDGAGDS